MLFLLQPRLEKDFFVSAALGPCLGAETMRMNEAEEDTFGSFGVTDKVVWESS